MFPFGDDLSFIKRPPFHLFDQLPNPPLLSKHDDGDGDGNSSFFPNFPSPFFDEHELPLNQIFPKPPIIPTSLKKESPKLKNKSAARPRKRTGKKDRHSKICTAQGIRDRRMRLSLQVARKFFDLQDMLGYDKASKTIEWLFTKSQKAIKELAKDAGISISATTTSGESFVSECEVVSGIEENCSNNNEVMKESEKKAKKPAREPRAKARCRTEEKMMMGKKKGIESSPNPNVLEKLGSSRSGPGLDGGDQERVSAEDYSPLVQPPSDAGTIEKLLGSSSSAAVSCCVDPSSSSSGFMGFLGNWDLLSNDHRLNYAGDNTNPNSIYITPDFPLFHQ